MKNQKSLPPPQISFSLCMGKRQYLIDYKAQTPYKLEYAKHPKLPHRWAAFDLADFGRADDG
jgi:hypothetical protein